MTRNRYFASVVPIAGIVYVIVLIAAPEGHHVAAIGAMVLAVVVLVGALVLRPSEGEGRQRNRNRNRS